MQNGGGRTDTVGCIRPHCPLGGEGYGYYGGRYSGHPYRCGMRMGHSAYGVAGAGWAAFCPRRPATAADSNSSGPLTRAEVDTTVEAAVMMTCPSIIVLDSMDRFGGAVCGLGMGMSNGSAAPGGVLDVGGFHFDDTSPQFPAAPDTLHGDSLYGLPSFGRGNNTIGSGAGGEPGRPRSAAGDSSGVGLFSSVVGGVGDASRAPGAAATATVTGGAGAYASRYT